MCTCVRLYARVTCIILYNMHRISQVRVSDLCLLNDLTRGNPWRYTSSLLSSMAASDPMSSSELDLLFHGVHLDESANAPGEGATHADGSGLTSSLACPNGVIDAKESVSPVSSSCGHTAMVLLLLIMSGNLVHHLPVTSPSGIHNLRHSYDAD